MGKTFSENEQHHPAGWSSRWNKEWKTRKMKSVSAGIVSVLPAMICELLGSAMPPYHDGLRLMSL